MNQTDTDIIKTNYYSPAIWFKSASSMYDKLKQHGITKKEITDFNRNCAITIGANST